jgi:hypothetical protein
MTNAGGIIRCLSWRYNKITVNAVNSETLIIDDFQMFSTRDEGDIVACFS